MAEPREWWIRITSKEFALPVLEVEGHLLEQFMGSEVVVVVPKTTLEAAIAERDANRGFLVITEKELEAAIRERDEARATLKASRPDVFTIITEQSYQLTAANAKVKELEIALEHFHENKGWVRGFALVEAQAQLTAEKAKSAGLVEALGWYASKEAWTINELEGSFGDYGTKARKALAQYQEGKK